eukprot:gene31320-39362_t
MLLLDEPSNHLDVETIQSLTEALRSFPGAVVVISHDRAFCEALDPTHVITVEDGALSWEQRGLREGDWKDDDLSAQAVKMLADIDSDKMTSALEAAVRPGAPEAAVAPAPPKPQTKELDQGAVAVNTVQAAGWEYDSLLTLTQLMQSCLVRLRVFLMEHSIPQRDGGGSLALAWRAPQARNTMGALGLSGEKATREIGMLSGGEKAHVVLSTRGGAGGRRVVPNMRGGAGGRRMRGAEYEGRCGWQAVTSVAEVRNRRLELYRSRSYDQWEIERVERVERQKAEYEKQQEEIDRLQDWVDKFGAKATKATQAESRKKMIAKLKREQLGVQLGTADRHHRQPIWGLRDVRQVQSVKVAPPEKISTHRPQLRLPKPPPCHTEMLVMKDVSFGWEEEPIVTGATLKIEKVLSRMEKFQRAKKRLDAAEVDIAVVDCNDGDALDAAVHELSEAQNDFEMAGGYSVDEVIGRVLSGLGFTEEDQSRSCSDFSGGWQMRIALARLLLSEPEILILDEPTNHLDAAARSWLAEYLKSYVGTVLTVTHDENLLRK